jgi:parvulin-like peptidyl-prolyl isomerase
MPESSFGNSSPFGTASPLAGMRDPLTPQVTSRPSSWPGGKAFEPESLGGPAARTAGTLGRRMPTDRQVMPASAIEEIPGLDQDAGFSFVEEQGGTRRRPKPKSAPSAPIDNSQPSNSPVGEMQPPAVNTPPLNAPSGIMQPFSTPAGNAPFRALPTNVRPMVSEPRMAPVQTPAATVAAPPVIAPSAAPPVTVMPAPSEPTVLNPYRSESIPAAGPVVRNAGPAAGAVLIPQLGAPPPGTDARPSVAPAAESIRSYPPLMNPYSLDATPKAVAAPPVTPPAEVQVNSPVSVPATPAAAPPMAAVVSQPPAQPAMMQPVPPVVAQPPVTQIITPPIVAQPATLPMVSQPPRMAPVIARQPAAPAQPPSRALENPFQSGVPGEPSLLSGRLSTPPAAVRLDGPEQQQLAGAQSSLIRNPFANPLPRTAEAPGTASASSLPAMPTMGQGMVIRNSSVVPSGEVFVTDGPSSRPTQAPPASPPAAAPAQPAAPTGPVQPWGPFNAPSTFRRDGPSAQAFPMVPPTGPATPNAPLNASGAAERSAVPAAAPPSPYLVASKSPDTTPAPAGTAAFPLQLPQPTSQRIANPPSQKAGQPEEMLLAQAGGPAGVAVADSSASMQPPPLGPLPPMSDKMSTPTQAASVEPGMAPCEGAQILARVGSEIILGADLAGPVNEMIAMNKDKIPADQLELAREQLTRRLLDSRIETKLAYQDAKRQLPAEAVTRVEKNIADAFDREEIEKLMKRVGAASRQELDVKLQSLGSSLEIKRRAFVEQMLAQQWIRQKVKVDGEVSHEQMIGYYHEHIADFEAPARARWEELEVRFSRHPRREEAYALIAQLGNRVLRGEPLAAVAKQASEGITAANGGQRDWTTRGSLVSRELDDALFGLPLNEPSQIIEDKVGLHIIRVLERKDAVRTPFTEAQVEIRKKIKDQRVESQMKAYLENLRRQVPIWTVYDDQYGKGGISRPAARGRG